MTIEPIAIGTPLYMRGRLGHVAAIAEASGRGFLVGGSAGAVPIGGDCAIVWDDGTVSTIPDAMARPYMDEAQRMRFPHADDIAERYAAAKARQEAQRQAARDDKARAEAERAAFEADAAARIPPWAKAVIVAELEQDESDGMSDYFNAKTVRAIILGFSTHTRDLFPELRKAAANHPDVAHLADAPEHAEHREKYSMGGGYYLKDGPRYSSGWKICKRRFWNGEAPVKNIPTGEWALAPAKAAAVGEAAPAAPVASSSSSGAPSGMRIEEHTHTKRGFQMWIAILTDRVERAEFDRLRTAAEALGGWYSRPWGRTPGGFAFKSADAAATFAGGQPADPTPSTAAYTGEAPAAAPPVPGLSPAIAEKLRSLADGMQGEIDGKFADRLANTPKRQRQAAEARQEGARLQRTQTALRKLAECHDAGTVPAVLARIASKAAAYDLMGSAIDRSRAGYYDAGIDTGKPAKDTPAALALWALVGGPSEAERKAETLRRKVADLRFANIPGYFPTPPTVVAEMIEAARLPDDAPFTLLEPEGGSGAILDAVRERFPLAEITTYERHASLCEVLALKGYTVAGGDFLEALPGPRFDVVMMNPPFESGQDAEHVRHAFAMLKPGGRLVAIMSPGPFFRQSRRDAEFREWFERHRGTRRDLPAGSFKASGTEVATVLVTMRRSLAPVEGGA